MKNGNGILIFNNSGMDLGLISALLEAEECTVYVTSHPLEALHILKNNNIDVILASAKLEGMEGEEFKELADKIKPGVSIFLLPTPLPAKNGDLFEPSTECTLNMKEFVLFIQNHIRSEKEFLDEAAGFKDFFFSFTDKLLQIFEVNDKYFFNNDHLVADLSYKMALKMNLDEKLVDAIHLAALLRDVGKIGVQQEILNGKERLENNALQQIKGHPLNTIQILKQIKFPWNIEAIIRHHHEHYDGNGYPDGLKGRFIPLGSRIIAIADSYVAMTTDRAYRKAMHPAEARQEIMKAAGTQFDPEVVESFFSVLQQQRLHEPERKQLLIVHPDESAAAYIRLNIEDEEFEVAIAGNAADALACMEQTPPVALIVALAALKADNFAFYNSIREMQIPCIIIAPQEEIAGLPDDEFLDTVCEPIVMDELDAKIKALTRDEAPKARVKISEEVLRGVSGSLEDMGITDIVQVLNMGMKTAKVILTHEKEKGEIYLKSGVIVYVKQGEMTGNDAFFEMIGWARGEFRILHGHVTDKMNITMDTMTLLLEASKFMDEKRYAAQKGQSAVPETASKGTEHPAIQFAPQNSTTAS